MSIPALNVWIRVNEGFAEASYEVMMLFLFNKCHQQYIRAAFLPLGCLDFYRFPYNWVLFSEGKFRFQIIGSMTLRGELKCM